MLQTLMAPLTGLYKLGGAEQRIMSRLGDVALNPQEAARLLNTPNVLSPGLLRRLGPYLPAQAPYAWLPSEQ